MQQPAPLLHNRWFGKATASACALTWSPPDPATIGACLVAALVVGHVFDRWSERLLHPAALASVFGRVQPHAENTEPYLAFTFAALGRISKAGGRVEPRHIAYTERLIERLGLNAERRANMIRCFNSGKTAEFDFASLPLPANPARETLVQMAAECMAACAAIRPDDVTRATVVELAGVLGLNPGEMARLEAHLARVALRVSRPTNHLNRAYRTLGITDDVGVEDAKRAYRRLVARCHPDKLPADASAEERRRAENRTHALREAYELVLAGADGAA